MVKLLLTGATGAIGSRVLSRLSQESTYDLFTLERYVTTRYVLGSYRQVKTLFADVRDAFAVRAAVRKVNPDVVIHLAAISPVAYSYEHPLEVVETNLHGTINLSEACLRDVPHFQHFLFASTSEVYGNGPSPKVEVTPRNPSSPYAVSKHAGEAYLTYLRDAYQFPVTILRPFNTYGRRDNAHFVVERIITQMLAHQRVLLGDRSPVRDLLYIDDHVDAYMKCLQNPQSIGQTYNFATGRGVSVGELADMIANLVGFAGEIVWDAIPARPLDIGELVGDASKAQTELDWRPTVSLEEGLERTIAHWRQAVGS